MKEYTYTARCFGFFAKQSCILFGTSDFLRTNRHIPFETSDFSDHSAHTIQLGILPNHSAYCCTTRDFGFFANHSACTVRNFRIPANHSALPFVTSDFLWTDRCMLFGAQDFPWESMHTVRQSWFCELIDTYYSALRIFFGGIVHTIRHL